MTSRISKTSIKVGSLLIFFLIIAVFAFFGSKDLIFGVRIKNVSLANGATLNDSVLKVTGNAKNATNLILNGREISIDQKGNFDETIALLSGYNVIDIRAEDKFGNTDNRDYKLMYIK